MNERDFELHAEETHKKLVEVDIKLQDLDKRLSGVLQMEMQNLPAEVPVKGSVTVNTEKAVEVTNLKVIHDAVKLLADETRKAIADTYTAPPEAVTVKNIAEARADTVKVNNMVEFSNGVIKALDPIIAQIANIEPVVKVEAQNIVWPRAAKDAIPVRLSDGKGFYNAMFSAVSQGVNTDGIIDAIEGISGGSSSSGISAYTLVQDEETATYEYYGYVKADGSWCIKRVTISTAYSQYVIGATDYTTAWTNRASQTYDDYWDVF